MDKVYSPADIEQRIYTRWEASGLFAPRRDGAGYCIVIPPPNVTGTLHMGHAFQDTIMDALTRYHRMRGEATLWQPGTDHAGIATQMVVERQLEGEGTHRTALGRDRFIERVWKWKGESGGTIARQMRRLGASVDWSRDRFTMDEGLSRAVTEVFVRLYEEGLIYRGKRLVNWDPVLQTAVSDLEVLSAEEEGSLWHLRYRLADGSGHLVVATTRPETLLGDTAVAVNPRDERYASLVGKQVRLPIADRLIPVIADDYVDPEFGSGCVKITPAHDFNDYEVGARHGLAQINVFTPDARMNETVPERLRGLDRFEARRLVVAELEAAGLIERIDPHKLMVPRGDRSGAVIEPYLTDQWYVKIAPLAEPAIEAVRNGSIRFVPDNWSRTYFEWMRNIKDWCISRQLWWGHRIPAWYDDAGQVHVGRTEGEVRARLGLAAEVRLRQDEDVLDTWFSSALWPFSTLGWPDSAAELRRFYPTAVLVTGFDIIFFWVARMIMMGIKFMGDVPFREVYVHGLVRDSEGQKMSKSKGNVIDPLDIVDGISLEDLLRKRTTGLMQPRLAPAIDKATRKAYPDGIAAYGTDALRFTFASLATQSADLRFDLARVGGYRNFCNKLWNASRYVLMVVEDQDGKLLDPALDTGNVEPGVADLWIASRLGETLRNVDQAFAEYRFDFAATALYEFTWYEFCDWYLELTKPILQSDHSTDGAKRAARRTLLRVLETLLRALHPLMPFITEEIWQRVAPLTGVAKTADMTVMTASWPQATEWSRDSAAETDVEWIKAFVLGVRQIRGEMDISPARRLPVLLENAGRADSDRLATHAAYLQRLAGLESLRVLETAEAAPPAAIAVMGDMRVLVPMAGLIDPQAEIVRLEKRIAKTRDEIKRASAKLANENFVRNAPADVVVQERTRIADFERTLAALEGQLLRVRDLL
ncbi:MAG: valine--tRNA ligase [Gammaproteobacteria bacterium]|nr:valine--tRNA ligase [Gammaproteobacteria bacterium]